MVCDGIRASDVSECNERRDEYKEADPFTINRLVPPCTPLLVKRVLDENVRIFKGKALVIQSHRGDQVHIKITFIV